MLRYEDEEEDYLGSCRLHLAFLLLVLLVGSGVHHQLFAPPEDRWMWVFTTGLCATYST